MLSLLQYASSDALPVTAAAPVGLACGLAAWLGVAQAQSGNISIDSTGGQRRQHCIFMLLCVLVHQLRRSARLARFQGVVATTLGWINLHLLNTSLHEAHPRAGRLKCVSCRAEQPPARGQHLLRLCLRSVPGRHHVRAPRQDALQLGGFQDQDHHQ